MVARVKGKAGGMDGKGREGEYCDGREVLEKDWMGREL